MATIEPMSDEDWPAVRAIYGEGIATGDASFDIEPPAWPEWDAGHLKSCRLVARQGGEVLGWAALSPVQRKSAYRGVAEGSIYVKRSAQRTGVGRALAEALVEASERAGLWTLEGWIFPENVASLELCLALGFRIIGVRERIGQREGRWRDVVVIERRSRSVGA
jgi:L-amino acid N-acyltransferase YncA